MAKHEPWHKPRKDEDADDALLDWLGQDARKGGGGGKGGGSNHNRSCMWVLAVGGGIVTALAALGTAGVRWLV